MIIPLWLRIAMAATILTAILGIGWSIHHMIWKSGWDDSEAAHVKAEKAAIDKRNVENHDELLAQELAKGKLQKGFEDEIIKLRNRIAAADRLRVGTPSCRPAGTTETKSASSSNGGDAGTRLVSADSQQDFDALELRIETVFAGCRTAQKFITDNGMAP